MISTPAQIYTTLKKLGTLYFEDNPSFEWEDIYSQPDDFYMALASIKELKNKKTGKHKLVCKRLTTYVACREELCFNLFNEKLVNNSFAYNFPLIFVIKSSGNSNISSGLLALNTLEKQYRWGLSFVIPEKTDNKKVVVIASKFWAETTFAASLFLLLLRLFSEIPIRKKESLQRYLIRVSNTDTEDGDYIKELLNAHKDFIRITMKHRLTIKNTSKKYFDYFLGSACDEDRDISFCEYEGTEIVLIFIQKMRNMLERNHGKISIEQIDNCCSSLSASNIGVVVSLTNLLEKYKGKRLSTGVH